MLKPYRAGTFSIRVACRLGYQKGNLRGPALGSEHLSPVQGCRRTQKPPAFTTGGFDVSDQMIWSGSFCDL